MYIVLQGNFQTSNFKNVRYVDTVSFRINLVETVIVYEKVSLDWEINYIMTVVAILVRYLKGIPKKVL